MRLFAISKLVKYAFLKFSGTWKALAAKLEGEEWFIFAPIWRTMKRLAEELSQGDTTTVWIVAFIGLLVTVVLIALVQVKKQQGDN